MASDDTQERNDDELTSRVELRGAAEMWRLAEQEERLADAADLPMVRAKHRAAAQRWALMAVDRDRIERKRTARRSDGLGGHPTS